MVPAERRGRAPLVLAAVAYLSVALAGCGDEAPAAGDARYTEAQVVRLAGLTRDEYGSGYTVAGCVVQDVPTSRTAVDAFRRLGWTVATNPKGDVGVTFPPQRGCRARLVAAMRNVP